jgi:hypothetical protein
MLIPLLYPVDTQGHLLLNRIRLCRHPDAALALSCSLLLRRDSHYRLRRSAPDAHCAIRFLALLHDIPYMLQLLYPTLALQRDCPFRHHGMML